MRETKSKQQPWVEIGKRPKLCAALSWIWWKAKIVLAIGNTLSSRKPFMLWYPTGRTEEESWSSHVKFDWHAHEEHINQNSGKDCVKVTSMQILMFWQNEMHLQYNYKALFKFRNNNCKYSLKTKQITAEMCKWCALRRQSENIITPTDRLNGPSRANVQFLNNRY